MLYFAMSYSFFGAKTKDEVMQDILLEMIQQQKEENRKLRDETRFKVGWLDLVHPSLRILLPQLPVWGRG